MAKDNGEINLKCERQLFVYFEGADYKKYLVFWGRLPNEVHKYEQSYRTYPLNLLTFNNQLSQLYSAKKQDSESEVIQGLCGTKFAYNLFDSGQKKKNPTCLDLQNIKFASGRIVNNELVGSDSGVVRAFPIQYFQKLNIDKDEGKICQQIKDYYEKNNNLQMNQIGGIYDQFQYNPDDYAKIQFFPTDFIFKQKNGGPSDSYLIDLATHIENYNLSQADPENPRHQIRVITPPVTTNSTYSFIGMQKQDVIDIPVFFQVVDGQEVDESAQDDDKQIAIRIFYMSQDGQGNRKQIIPITIMSITAKRTQLTQPGVSAINASGASIVDNLYIRFQVNQDLLRFNAGYPALSYSSRKVSRYLYYPFDYNKDITSTTIKASPGGFSNEFIGVNPIRSGKIIVKKKAIKGCKFVYFTGTIAVGSLFKQIVQVHEKHSNDIVRLFKTYDWERYVGQEAQAPVGQQLVCQQDKYNCLRSQTKVEAFNFKVVNNFQLQQSWRISQTYSDIFMLLARMSKINKADNQSPAQIYKGKQIPLFWVCDMNGFGLICAKTDGYKQEGIKWQLSQVTVIPAADIQGEQWFNAYLQATGYDQLTVIQHFETLTIDLKQDMNRDLASNYQQLRNISSGLMFDVSPYVNSRLIDHHKIPYQRSLALALNFIREKMPEDFKIGVKSLDLVDLAGVVEGNDIDKKMLIDGQNLNQQNDEQWDLAKSQFKSAGFSGMDMNGDITMDYKRFQSYLCGKFRRHMLRRNGSRENVFTINRNNKYKKIKKQYESDNFQLQIGTTDYASILDSNQTYYFQKQFIAGVYEIIYETGAFVWEDQQDIKIGFHYPGKANKTSRIVAEYRGNILSKQYDDLKPNSGIYIQRYNSVSQALSAFYQGSANKQTGQSDVQFENRMKANYDTGKPNMRFVHFGGKIGIRIIDLRAINQFTHVKGYLKVRVRLLNKYTQDKAHHHMYIPDNMITGVKTNVLMPSIINDNKFQGDMRIYLQTFACDRQNGQGTNTGTDGFNFAASRLRSLNLFTQRPIQFFGYDIKKKSPVSGQFSSSSSSSSSQQELVANRNCLIQTQQISIASTSLRDVNILTSSEFQYRDLFTYSPVNYHILKDSENDYTFDNLFQNVKIKIKDEKELLEQYLVPQGQKYDSIFLNYIFCNGEKYALYGALNSIKDSLNKQTIQSDQKCYIYKCENGLHQVCDGKPLDCQCVYQINYLASNIKYGYCLQNYSRCESRNFIIKDKSQAVQYYTCDGEYVKTTSPAGTLGLFKSQIQDLAGKLNCEQIKQKICCQPVSSSQSQQSQSSSSSSSLELQNQIMPVGPVLRNDYIYDENIVYNFGRIFNFNNKIQFERIEISLVQQELSFDITAAQFDQNFRALKSGGIEIGENGVATTEVDCLHDGDILSQSKAFHHEFEKVDNFAAYLKFKAPEKTYMCNIIILGMSGVLNIIQNVAITSIGSMIDVRFSQIYKILVIPKEQNKPQSIDIQVLYISKEQFFKGARFTNGGLGYCPLVQEKE